LIPFDHSKLCTGDCGTRVDLRVLAQMRSNSRFDPIVVPIGYQFGYGDRVLPVESGKNGNAGVYPLDQLSRAPERKTSLTFDDWLSLRSEPDRPTADSLKLWFGGAQALPVQTADRKDDRERLLVIIPELGGLERSEMVVRARERKHLFRTYFKYLRQRAPELFKHPQSEGPNDIRVSCARCGGNYTRSRERFVCGDCGLGGFDKIELTTVTPDLNLGDMDDPNPLTEIEGNVSHRDRELTIQEFVSVALANRHRYKGDVKTRLTLVFNYLTAQEPTWTLKDHADSVSRPENTADSWVKRFRKDVAEFRLTGQKLVGLDDSARDDLRQMLGLRPQKAYILENRPEKQPDTGFAPSKILRTERESEAA
jgi:hypothetical protein